MEVFIALLAILNPWGVIPMFLALTGSSTNEERKHVALTIGLSVAAILLVTALPGEVLLSFFRISVESFQVGGSILLLLMAIGMMYGNKRKGEDTEVAVDMKSIAVVPLSVPLLTGPGSIPLSSSMRTFPQAGCTWD